MLLDTELVMSGTKLAISSLPGRYLSVSRSYFRVWSVSCSCLTVWLGSLFPRPGALGWKSWDEKEFRAYARIDILRSLHSHCAQGPPVNNSKMGGMSRADVGKQIKREKARDIKGWNPLET